MKGESQNTWLSENNLCSQYKLSPPGSCYLFLHRKETVTLYGDNEPKGENTEDEIHPGQDQKLTRTEKKAGEKRWKAQTAEAFASSF